MILLWLYIFIGYTCAVAVFSEAREEAVKETMVVNIVAFVIILVAFPWFWLKNGAPWK